MGMGGGIATGTPRGSSTRGSMGDDLLYKADGTVVRDPAAYVAAFEKKGGMYEGGLFNAKGVEIRDPIAYIARMGDSRVSVGRGVPPWRSANGADDRAVYKADGTQVRDPVAYVAGIEKKGLEYKGDLLTSKGEVIRDPFAYVARMTSGKV